MAFNDFQLGLVGHLDGAKSKNQLNQDIKAIYKTLEKLKLRGEFDPAQIQSLERQLNSLKVELNNATFSQAAINGLVSQINRGLNGIQIQNINVGGQTQQVGQQIGQQLGESINNGINKSLLRDKADIKFEQNFDGNISAAKEAEKYFSKLLSAEKAVVTTTETFDDSGLKSFIVNIKRANGEVETLKYELNEIGSFVLKGGTVNDTPIIKQFSQLKKHISDYEIKFNNFKAKYLNADIDTSGFTDVFNRFKAGSATLEEVKIAFNQLETAAKNATQSLKSQQSSFDPIQQALNNMRDMPNFLNALETGIIEIKDKTSLVGVSIDDLRNDYSELLLEMNKNGGKIPLTEEWTSKYQKLMSTIVSTTKQVETLKKIESSDTSKSSKQTDYYKKIIDNNKKIYSLKTKLLSSTKEETIEINRQIKALEQRNRYNKSQLSKKGLKDNSWERIVNNSKNELENQLKISTANKIGNIKFSVLDDGDMTTKIEILRKNFSKLGLSSEEVEAKMSKVDDAFKVLIDSINKGANEDVIISDFNNLQSELKQTQNNLKLVRSEYSSFVTDQRRLSLANTIEAWNQKNTKATKEVRNANEVYIASLRRLDKEMSKMEFDEISVGFKNAENSMRAMNRLGASLKDQFKQAAESFTQWISVSSAIMSFVYQLQKIPKKVIEVDDAITDFTMATNVNKEQIESFIDTYAKLGDKLSATVTDVTISATEWLKQGKSIEEAETLIADAMILSKVGKLSSAEATKYLTAVMKSYKVSAEDTLGVVDKLSAVDMASATDVGGLAEGISTVANNARLAGVSMDKLLGYLAAVGEVSQEGMSGVGTAYNAIFARMGNIKLSRLKDYETGEDLSNVETVLRGVGISLRDSQDEFRNFDEVLDETANRWTSFSEVQQRAIANAFAGTHHVDSFITLMENYDNALKYSEVSMNSSGQAMEKFAAYEDSITAHTERFENAFIQMSNTVLDSDFLKAIIDAGTLGVKAIDGLIGLVGSLNTVLLGTGGIAFFKNLD